MARESIRTDLENCYVHIVQNILKSRWRRNEAQLYLRLSIKFKADLKMGSESCWMFSGGMYSVKITEVFEQSIIRNINKPRYVARLLLALIACSRLLFGLYANF